MDFPKHIWDQLRNKTAKDLETALQRDGATLDSTKGAIQAYRYPNGKRITIHPHPNKTYGPKLLKALLDDLEWTEDDLRRLKLVK